jgi:hypothetical protein
MKKRLLTIALVFILAFGITTTALAQDYFFSLDREVVNVFWNSDGTMSLDYLMTFTNQPGGHAIEFVDVGMPNGNFDFNSIRADINGNPLSISSDFEGTGSDGFAVEMGAYAIPPGQSGTVHVYVGRIDQILHPDDNDEAYASAVFAPAYFISSVVTGSTDLTVTFHLPPGVQEQEPRYHNAPSGFPSEPQGAFDSEGRITYTWNNPQASGSRSYVFGSSFPRSYVPAESIYTPPPTPPISVNPDTIFSLLCMCFFGFIFVGIPGLTAYANRNRKLQYMAPKISIEGHGIKRGLTAVEAAILMEQPLDKVMTMILFGAVKKNAAVVTKRDPLEITVTEPQPEGLHEYESKFLQAFKESGTKERRTALQNMTVALVKSVSEKMKGFSRKETIEYYKRIMETAWEQVQKAETPEVQMALFDKQLEWTMLDKDYDDRSRRVFRGPVFVPMWWGNYDPTFHPRQASTGGGLPSSTAGQTPGRVSLPGADFAASVVTSTQTFSQKVIGNVQDFTSRVTNVTNPMPKTTSSGSRGGGRSGGGGRSCACACACAGCACACAGGGR